MKRYIKCGRQYNAEKAFSVDPNVRAKYASTIKNVELLEIYSHDPVPYVRECVANNPATPLDVLRQMIEDPTNGFFVLRELARNPNTPVDGLKRLVQLERGDHVDLKMCIASNPSAPADLLSELSKISFMPLHRAIVYNRNTPPDIIDKLVKNDPYDVRGAAADNPNTRSETLAFIFDNTSEAQMDYRFLRSLARNPNTPVDLLNRLVKDTYLKDLVEANPSYRGIV